MCNETISKENGSVFYVWGICLVATLGGLLFGYDTAVISGAIGFLQTHFELDAVWKGWAASSALVGCILGAMVAGKFSDAFGRKKVLIFAAVMFLISAIGTAIPRTLTQFIIFRIVGGIGVGAASMTSPMYIAEISPAKIRGRMVSLNQFAIIFGMLVVYFVNYFIEGQGSETWNLTTGWRWMFGSEAIPAFMLLVLMFVVPETPRWLVKQGKHDAALKILKNVGGESYAESEMQQMEKTISHESSSIFQLFEPKMLIVLVIGITLAVFQQITGINVVLYYAPEIFKSMGSGTSSALFQTIIVGAVNLLFTVVAIWTVDKLGRKPLLLIGSAGMGISMFAIGFAAYMQNTGSWVLFFILGYIACFALSLGPVVWVYLSEIFPTKIRGRAMAIATFSLWIACFTVSQTFPMLHENKYLVDKFHHGFSFWIYGAMCILTFIFVYAFVPETKGKSLEEIEEMWAKGKSKKKEGSGNE